MAIENPGRRLGYVRVSKSSQDEAGQVKKLLEEGHVERRTDIYCDKGFSGAKTSRPELDRLLREAQAGDTIVVFKLDRIGRSTGHTITLIEDLIQRNIHVESLVDGLNTRTLAGETMLKMLAVFAQMERAFIIERTRAGLDAAATSGRRGGRPSALTRDQVGHAQSMHDQGKSADYLAKYFKVSRASIYRALGSQKAA